MRILQGFHSKAQCKQSYLLALLCAVLISSLTNAAPALARSAYTSQTASGSVVNPFVYVTPGSATTYDVMLADGINKDRRIASVKVDGVGFGDASARLSQDGSHAAVRVTGDRYGGSSLHIVGVKNGKATQAAVSSNSSEGIGTYRWSPSGNTLAFVRSAPALDPANVEDAYGDIFIISVGFQAMRLQGSQSNDRLLAFSGDGLGVYVTRREQVDGGTMEHLVYLPTNGGEPVVLLRSRPELRYSNFAVYSPPGVPAKIAALAEGTFVIAAPTEVAPIPAATSTPGPAPFQILATSDIGLERPRGMGLVVSDSAGTWPALLRQDAESYTYLTWNSNGQGLLMGGGRNGTSWTVDMAGNKRPVEMSLFGMRAEAWSEDGITAVLTDNPATRLVTLDFGAGNMLATRYVGAVPQPGAAAVKLAVPYVHQVNDTAPNGDGNWACGPTSIAMTLAYYGKLDPWPVYMAQQAVSGTIAIQIPQNSNKATSGADYAPYVTNSFNLNGRTYDSLARDPRGNMLAGLYGTICPTGLADWQTMVSVLNSNGLGSQYVGATWDGITAALKRGHPVLLGNELTSAGHILVVVGYTPNGNLIVNDPYGNRFAPGYGATDGRGLYYPWKRATPRRALEVIGVYPPPIRTPFRTATPYYSPTPLPGILTPTPDPAQPTFVLASPTVEPPTSTLTPIPIDTPTPEPPTEVSTNTPTLTPEPGATPISNGSGGTVFWLLTRPTPQTKEPVMHPAPPAPNPQPLTPNCVRIPQYRS